MLLSKQGGEVRSYMTSTAIEETSRVLANYSMLGIERHPLARGGWCTRFVPVGFLMIYAPRTEEEVGVVMDIVLAGIGWVSGERLDESNACHSNGNEDAAVVDCCGGGCNPGNGTSTRRNEAGVVQDVANAVMEVA